MAERKKILYVITKSVWGGAQRYVYDLATNLPKDRFEVTVVAGGDGLLIEKLQKSGIRVIKIPHLERDINFIKELLSFWDLFKIFCREKPDVIHLNSSKAGGLGAIAAFFYKVRQATSYKLQAKVVFTVHGWSFNDERPRWQKKIIRFLSWFASLFQDKIILIDKPDLRDAERIIPRHKLELIFNGIGEIDFLPRKDARKFFSEKIGREIMDDTFVIGTIAELTPNKGLMYLLNALDALSRRSLDSYYRGFASIVIGEGGGRRILEEKIRKQSPAKSVYLLGFVPQAEKYMKGFDIFVLPSLKEGLPYVLLEAMSAGVPIIGTTVGGITDIIDQHETGLFVTPKDVKGLADVIIGLMTDRDLRKKLSENGLKKINMKFKLHDMVERTIKLYRS